jgi:prolyl-tRNA synthetase
MVRRDTGQKTIIKETDIPTAAENLLQDIQNSMFEKAKKLLQEKITTAQNYNEFKQVIENKGGFIKAAWCGDPVCEAKIKEETSATIRIIPFNKEETKTGCIYCNKESKEVAYFARSY